MKNLLRWVPMIALILTIAGVLYNQGNRIEHRLTRLETLMSVHLKLPETPTEAKAGDTTGRVALLK